MVVGIICLMLVFLVLFLVVEVGESVFRLEVVGIFLGLGGC